MGEPSIAAKSSNAVKGSHVDAGIVAAVEIIRGGAFERVGGTIDGGKEREIIARDVGEAGIVNVGVRGVGVESAAGSTGRILTDDTWGVPMATFPAKTVPMSVSERTPVAVPPEPPPPEKEMLGAEVYPLPTFVRVTPLTLPVARLMVAMPAAPVPPVPLLLKITVGADV